MIEIGLARVMPTFEIDSINTSWKSCLASSRLHAQLLGVKADRSDQWSIASASIISKISWNESGIYGITLMMHCISPLMHGIYPNCSKGFIIPLDNRKLVGSRSELAFRVRKRPLGWHVTTHVRETRVDSIAAQIIKRSFAPKAHSRFAAGATVADDGPH